MSYITWCQKRNGNRQILFLTSRIARYPKKKSNNRCPDCTHRGIHDLSTRLFCGKRGGYESVPKTIRGNKKGHLPPGQPTCVGTMGARNVPFPISHYTPYAEKGKKNPYVFAVLGAAVVDGDERLKYSVSIILARDVGAKTLNLPEKSG